jgi:hypothetical protein
MRSIKGIGVLKKRIKRRVPKDCDAVEKLRLRVRATLPEKMARLEVLYAIAGHQVDISHPHPERPGRHRRVFQQHLVVLVHKASHPPDTWN